jgi:hypothetical protein
MSSPQTLAEILFPARDDRFDTLVHALSAPATGPVADNFMSNEDSYPRVTDELARRVRPGGVYLGVGPDQNFTFLAHTRPALAFVLDYRRRNLLVHLLHKALFSLSTSRADYLRRFLARDPGPLPADPTAAQLVEAFRQVAVDHGRLATAIAEAARFLRPLGLVKEQESAELARIQTRLAGPGMNCRFLAMPMYPTLAHFLTTTDRQGNPSHFLARESHYRAVRELQLGDRVLPLVGDFRSPDSLPPLGAWLRRHRLRLSLLYVSDVEFFLVRGGGFPAYLDNLAQLPRREDALVVRTSTRPIDHPARVAGDSSTTLVTRLDTLLALRPRAREVRPDDLFPNDAPPPEQPPLPPGDDDARLDRA